MKVLAIETSCDETAAAVVEDGRRVLSDVVSSQVEVHARFGGVVPEVASRQHLLSMLPVLDRALSGSINSLAHLDAVAVTCGPGLAGSLLVGVNTAKAIALARGLPLIGVNHLEGHIYANWLADGHDPSAPEPAFPLVCLVASGGHSDILFMRGHGDYTLVAQTRDDAAGEALDKAARILGLGYPGGPAIERKAAGGSPSAVHLPRARIKGSLDFSFSGLKTALWHLVERARDGRAAPPFSVADAAASFQEAVAEALADRTAQAARLTGARRVLLAGGVAANARLRQLVTERSPVPVDCPPPRLCTDNAAMIAACAFYALRARGASPWDLDAVPNLRTAGEGAPASAPPEGTAPPSP